MIRHKTITPKKLFRLIREGKVQYAGNRKLKIYGTLNCWSGKRMKKENRVFFESKYEAERNGYRRCKHCLGH